MCPMPHKNRKKRFAVTLSQEAQDHIKIIQDEYALMTMSATLEFCVNEAWKQVKMGLEEKSK